MLRTVELHNPARGGFDTSGTAIRITAEVDGTMTIRPEGDMMESYADELRTALLHAESHKIAVRLDLSVAGDMDSRTLCVLAAFSCRWSKLAGPPSLQVIGASDDFNILFRATRLSRVWAAVGVQS